MIVKMQLQEDVSVLGGKQQTKHFIVVAALETIGL